MEQQTINAVGFTFLKSIKYNDIESRLFIVTDVEIDTSNNECAITYSVESFKSIILEENTFMNYEDAYAYYQELYNKYGIEDIQTNLN